MHNPKRRDFLRWSFSGASGLALYAAATGLPLPFLRSGRVAKANTEGDAAALPSYLVLALNSSGWFS